ncbi:MAG: DUF3000 family protein [Bifidobacteriaceae bacterium]|jgi:hypothetical protein|nr:DUF3000 family protein [Bifidobacteriaceae bacterium]
MASRDLPKSFREAIHSLMGLEVDKKIKLKEIMPPTRISPYSLAVEATIEDESKMDTTLGNFIVIYKEDEAQTWGSPFRVITHITSGVENVMATDPVFRQHIWSKFCNTVMQAPSININGTVTTSVNEYFDSNDVQVQQSGENIEDSTFDLRASWSTQNSNMKPHFLAWIQSFTSLTNSDMLF